MADTWLLNVSFAGSLSFGGRNREIDRRVGTSDNAAGQEEVLTDSSYIRGSGCLHGRTIDPDQRGIDTRGDATSVSRTDELARATEGNDRRTSE